jgi:Tripartite tricarboxylate transporter TctB family
MSRPLAATPTAAFTVVTAVAVDLLVLWGLTIGGYPGEANLFPALSAGFLTLMAAIIVLRPPRHAPDPDQPLHAAAVLWLGGLLAVLVLLGFRIGLPLFAVAYAGTTGARRWQAALLGVAVSATVEILFRRILGTPLDWGWLIETLAP